LEHEGVTTPSIGYYYMTPGAAALPQADAKALALLTHIAGTEIIGRVHRRLVMEDRLATSVAASYSPGVQAGSLTFTALAAPGVAEADLERALAAQIATLARDGVSETDVDNARRGFLAAKVYEDDNHRKRAASYGYARVVGLTIADVDAADDVVARLTAADINRVAASILGKSQPVIGVLRPRTVSRVVGPKSTVQ